MEFANFALFLSVFVQAAFMLLGYIHGMVWYCNFVEDRITKEYRHKSTFKRFVAGVLSIFCFFFCLLPTSFILITYVIRMELALTKKLEFVFTYLLFL